MIYVFKTSVATEKDITKLTVDLDELLPGARWNFDLDDSDNILRIDTTADVADAVTTLLLVTGFDCEELF
ncbi:hypothetical protein ACLI09_03635 [Flavobacterium sp. RHBU_24]|uniref:hypothetical protein n=1 Tax=Flavobacterium sp. RHBU_24 TaxID=3391185 RepID=UPI0039846D24